MGWIAMGWAWTVLLNGLLGLAGYWAARGPLGQPPGLVRGLAAAVLAWTWATLGVIALGACGVLTLPALMGWAVAGLGLAALGHVLVPSTRVEVVPRPGTEGPWDVPAILGLGLTAWACLSFGMPSLLMPPKVVSDGPIYHLYFAVRWWKEAGLSLIPTPFGETAAPYFPAGGDAWFAWLTVPLGGDRLARVGQAPFLLLAGLATFAIASRLGVRRSAAALATSWFLTSLPMIGFSFEANVDTLFMAGYLIAFLFGLRYAMGDGDGRALALASLAAGLAWGTKPTAMVFIPPLLGLGAVAVATSARPTRAKLGHLALLAILPMVPAGYWFARIAALTGNPLYPLHLSAFGRTWWPGWFERSAMVKSTYYLPAGNAKMLVDVVVRVLDARLAPIWLAAGGGAWMIGRGGRDRAGWVWLCSAWAVVNVATFWLLIPYRTQQRFMLQALALAAVPLGRWLDRSRWLRWLAAALLAVHLLTPESWPFTPVEGYPPWTLSRVAQPMLTSPVPLPSLAEVAGFAGLNLLRVGYDLNLLLEAALGFAIALAWTRGARRPALAWGVTAAAVAAEVLVLGGVLGMTQIRYPSYRDYARGWRALDAYSGDGVRVAYAGTNLPYYLMGPDWRNEVRYVNVDAHRDWLMHDYHRAAIAEGNAPWPTPRPGWDRLRPDYDAWLANLRAAGIQVLVVARANPAEGGFNIADREGFTIERVWADAHPEVFRPIHGVADPDPNFKIYRILPP